MTGTGRTRGSEGTLEDGSESNIRVGNGTCTGKGGLVPSYINKRRSY